MSRESIRKALYQYVDQIVTGEDNATSLINENQTDRTELEALFAIVNLLRKHLFSSEPSAAFRQNLRLQLVTEAVARAYENDANRRQNHLPTIHRKDLIFGAAAIGSLVSVAAFVITQRNRSHNQTKTAA